ncbi:MAG: c-type cytochrome [Aureliella sp.]
MCRNRSWSNRIKVNPDSASGGACGRRAARSQSPGRHLARASLIGLAVVVGMSLISRQPQSALAQEKAEAANRLTESATAGSASKAPPALRIVKLLWKTQPKNAAGALEKLIDQSLTRRQADELKPHLPPLDPQFRETLSDPEDVRWVASVAAVALYDSQAAARWLELGVAGFQRDGKGRQADLPLPKRDFLLRVWLETGREAALAYVHAQLASASPDSDAKAAWLETVALRGLQADLQATARQLVELWPRLPKNVQIAVVEPLTQHASSMRILVDAIAAGKISKDLLNTNQLLKWSSSNDAELTAAIERVWGKLRVADDADRKAVVAKTLAMLQSGKTGNPVAGQQIFKRVCSQCHRLHSEGIEVGPDISVNGRGSFEQLVSNVMDPSLVIGKAFIAKTVLTTDSRVLSGLLAAEDDKRLTLKIQGGKLVELDREEDIEEIKDSAKSLMPDGLEQQMSEQELVDLFAYLSLTKPLSAPENETIPGTPPKLLGP